jgi:hypothetical protein
MPNDIFSRTSSQVAGTFRTDDATLIMPGNNDGDVNLGVLTQQIQINYQQQITRIYELASADQYYVGGRAQGQATFGRIIGPAGTVKEMYNKYGDICRAHDNNLTINLEENDCQNNESGGGNYDMIGTVIQSVGISVAAQDMIINEQTQTMFTSLEVSNR